MQISISENAKINLLDKVCQIIMFDMHKTFGKKLSQKNDAL